MKPNNEHKFCSLRLPLCDTQKIIMNDKNQCLRELRLCCIYIPLLTSLTTSHPWFEPCTARSQSDSMNVYEAGYVGNDEYRHQHYYITSILSNLFNSTLFSRLLSFMVSFHLSFYVWLRALKTVLLTRRIAQLVQRPTKKPGSVAYWQGVESTVQARRPELPAGDKYHPPRKQQPTNQQTNKQNNSNRWLCVVQ